MTPRSRRPILPLGLLLGALLSLLVTVDVSTPPTAVTISQAPCAVLRSGEHQAGKCLGVFDPTALPVPTAALTSTPSPSPTPNAPASATATGRAKPTLTATQARTSPPTSPPSPGCIGPQLTSQSQVQPNASYCGGQATSRIVLADGDTWVGGEVTGVATGRQEGAVNCASNCTLVNMNVHDNPTAFAGIYMASGVQTNVSIIGGRVTGSGSLGIGGGDADGLTIHDVEIDHNGATADCGFEGGGFKGGATHHLHFFNNYVHDNNCMGVWLDINSANNEIDHNRVINNGDGGIFYEISQDASIHNNDVEGNGARACSWLWGAGIGIASSFNIQIYGNTLRGNCNGITGTQQNRPDSTPPAHLLENLSINGNSVAAPGKTGVAADNGADLTTRNIVFANNSYSGGAVLCGFAC